MTETEFYQAYEKSEYGNNFIEETVAIDSSCRGYRLLKRSFDIVISIIGIILFLLPSIIIIICIKVCSEGPAFYSQLRLGLNGKEFSIYKFRTMTLHAEEDSPVWAAENDERETKVGRFLRKNHLDEIPQFINVLKGDMSIVGPRPEREYFYNEFSKYIKGFDQRMLVPQGLTGLAQISGGYNLKPEEKIIYDLYYIKHRSIILDIKIFIMTIFSSLSIIRKKN